PAHDRALGAAPAAPPPSTPSLLGRDALVGRVAGVIEKLTGVRYASTQTWMILRQRLGWTRQRPARRAAERDDAAIEAWVKRDWPRIKRGPVGEAPGSSSRTNPGLPSPGGEGHLGPAWPHAGVDPPVLLDTHV